MNQKGEGVSIYKNKFINRFKSTDDYPQGIFFNIKNIKSKKIWSSNYKPNNKYQISFMPDKIEQEMVNDNIKTKIEKVAKEIYGATGVKFSEEAEGEINRIERLGYGNLPVCIAKTQYSFSDDAKNLECKEPFEITIRDVNLKAGAGFIVAISGKIMTMPGLPRIPAAENIDIDENGEIVGIF